MTRTPAHLLTPARALPERLREARPLVQCVTNSVTTNFVANVLLAIGASPAMVDIPGEARPFAAVASGVLLNLGTPSHEQREAMIEAAESANAAGTPWVLDPVAVGSLPVRTELAHRLVRLAPTVIRGNASEIRALAGAGAGADGVDAADAVDDVRDAAVSLARSSGAVVAVSGPVDLITDGDRVVRIANGDPILTVVTGAGCALGGVVAAALATHDDPFTATVAACTVYGVAAQRAAEVAHGPGSFVPAFLDALNAVDAASVDELARVS